jgi:transmembrane sensor
MTDEPANPFEKGQLKREAIDWWVKMHDADADAHRADFGKWLERGALHRSVYNRVAQVYGTGKKVDWEAIPPDRHVRGTARRALLAVIGMLVLCGFIGWRLILAPIMMSMPGSTMSEEMPHTEQVQLVTRIGEMRKVRLSDGSWLTLDTDTLVTVDYSRGERELRLEHGRARFDVSHEPRPFEVDAGDAQVVAHGTMFDVSLWEDRTVHVHLLRGSVVVRKPLPTPSSHALQLAALSPGEGLTYPSNISDSEHVRPTIEPAIDWPLGSIEFKAGTLGVVIDAANRYSTTKIAVEDSELRNIPVSGVFRVSDPQRLANSLSLLFDLKLTGGPNEIVLGRQRK